MTLPSLRTLLFAAGGLLLGVGLGVAYFLISSRADIAACATVLQDSLTAPDSTLRGLLYRTTCRDPLGTSVEVISDDPHAAPAEALAGAPRLGSIPVGTEPAGQLGLRWRSSDTLVVLRAGTVVGIWRRIRDPQSGRLVLVRLPPVRSN